MTTDEDARIISELNRLGGGPDPFSAAVRATRTPMIITDPRKPDNPIVFVNAAFLELTGYDRHEVMGRNCRFLQGQGTDQNAVARLSQAISSLTSIELELLNYRKNGTTFWNRVLVSPVFNEGGELSYFFASQFDVTLERERLTRLEQERLDLESTVARRDAEIVSSEERLRFALKAGQMGSWSLDIDSGRMIASDGCKENFDRPVTEPFTYQDLMDAVHPNDRERRDEAVAISIAKGTLLDVEYRLLTPAGGERWVQIRGQANYRADGTPLAMNGISQNITGRKQSEEHRALLANALSHRVKNGLAIMQAVIVQTLRRANSLKEAETTLQSRVLAMSAANDLLVDQSWKGADLRTLLVQTLAPFGVEDRSRFELLGLDVHLPPNVANSLALGFHEMATNAVKYRALSIDKGRVRIDWKVGVATSTRYLRIAWIESGGPAVRPPEKKVLDRL